MLSYLEVNVFTFIILAFKNNLMRMLNHPMLQMRESMLREGKCDQIHSAFDLC